MVKRILYRKMDNLYLPIILIVSVVLRLGSVAYFGNDVTGLPGVHDQFSYHYLSLRVLDGFGFTFGEPWWPVTPPGEPTAHWSYLYTSYLIGVYGLFGRFPLVARIIQVLFVGTLHPYLTYKIGERIFSKTVGLIAAGWSAVYIYFIYYSAALVTEPVYITSILATIYFALKLSDSSESENQWRNAVLLGVCLAITVLLRQLFVLFVPFMFLWIWWTSDWKKTVHLVIAGLILVGSVLPLTAFNYSRFNQFVLLNTNAGFAFFWGNHPIHGTKFIPILDNDTYRDLIPQELHSLSEADLEDELMDRAIQFIVDDPVRYAQLSASRILNYFMFWPSSESSLISNISRVLSFGVALPFIIYGLWLSLKRWRFNMRSPETLLYLFMGFYTCIHLLSWALVRYRLPVDAIFLVFSGLALVQLFEPVAEKYKASRSVEANNSKLVSRDLG